MVAVYTWEDVPKKRFSIAGQTFPEPSPYDRLILDRHVRSVGDAVAIVVGESEKAVDKALNMIKVKYTILEPVLDFRKSLDNKVLVHPEDDWSSSINTGDVKRNLIHHEEDEHGNVEKILSECDEIIEHTYRIKAAQQAYMETCRAYCEIDRYGRLHCISSTQIVFHLRRILSNALDIPKSMVRAEKPRIGGGFGAKQTAVCEVYPAFVTWKTKRPSKIIYSRKECQTIASPRHEMEVTVRLGAMRDGHIRAIDLYTLSNGGAYGEHSTTTVGLSGHKSLPLYTGGCEATRFSCDVVYTNVQAAGAYRGYGATQGIFALESTVNELAEKLHIDPVELRENIKKIGAQMLGHAASEVDFDGKEVYIINPDGADNGEVCVSLSDIATKSQINNTIPVDVTATYSSPVSPPPYMVGMVEIELDKETGAVKILDYQAVVDCGIPVNPNLARVQTEGGIGQGIGMALYENVTYNAGGKIAENDLMQYKIPTRQDVGNINVEFETSYEPSGPFGVKSIGEIVINTPAPALAHAIYRATGVWHRTVPFTPEKILMGMVDPNWHEKDLRVK